MSKRSRQIEKVKKLKIKQDGRNWKKRQLYASQRNTSDDQTRRNTDFQEEYFKYEENCRGLATLTSKGLISEIKYYTNSRLPEYEITLRDGTNTVVDDLTRLSVYYDKQNFVDFALAIDKAKKEIERQKRIKEDLEEQTTHYEERTNPWRH